MSSEIEGLLEGARGLADCYFRGTTIYVDAAGIRRRFVFTRKFVAGGDRFLATGSPEDEYTD
jgi:hypothetical protein